MKLPTDTTDQFWFNTQSDRPKRASPRPVRLLQGDDFRCAMYGSLGFSTLFIMQHTDLTQSQIAYRLRKGSIRRKDYRNGESIVATRALEQVRTIALSAVKQHLKEVMSGGKRG